MGVDAGAVFAGMGGAAMVQSLIMLLAKRWMGRVDQVEADLKEIKDKQIAKVEKGLEDAGKSRAGIHQRIAEIEREMVRRSDLERMRVDYVGQVRELAQVATRIEVVNRHLDEQMQKLTAVTADVNRILGRLDK